MYNNATTVQRLTAKELSRLPEKGISEGGTFQGAATHVGLQQEEGGGVGWGACDSC